MTFTAREASIFQQEQDEDMPPSYLTLILCFLPDGKGPSDFLRLTRVGED